MSEIARYDVVIVGGAFAGVSCAQELQKNGVRSLLIDRWEIGSNCNSACLAPLHTVEQFRAADSVLEVYDRFFIHTPEGGVCWKLPVLGCIFDYQRFFTAMLHDTPIEFRQARVIGLDQDVLVTPNERLQADAYVDVSGWRAVLATSLQPTYGESLHNDMGVGVETELDHPVKGLHFYINPALIKGYAWAFGCGATTRFGVASFHPCNRIRDHLIRFLRHLGIKELGALRGSRIPFGLRDPVVDKVFTVGDAAGQAIPTSAEGIRPALLAGKKLGRLLAGFSQGEYDLDYVKQAYSHYYLAQHRTYEYMRTFQHLMMTLPPRLSIQFVRLFARESFMSLLWRYYGPVFDDKQHK